MDELKHHKNKWKKQNKKTPMQAKAVIFVCLARHNGAVEVLCMLDGEVKIKLSMGFTFSKFMLTDGRDSFLGV